MKGSVSKSAAESLGAEKSREPWATLRERALNTTPWLALLVDGVWLTKENSVVVSDGLPARMGSVTANQEWFKVWRTIDGEGDAPKTALELEVLGRGVFERQRFLDLLPHLIVFEEDPDAGAVSPTPTSLCTVLGHCS